jgi:hypothetical protein
MKTPLSPALAVIGMALGMGFLSPCAQAQDRADIDRTKIIGNRELPKVLYIVPWKKPLPGNLAGKPLQSVLDEALSPIDRDVLRRQIDYGAQAKAQTANPSQTNPASPVPPNGEPK